MFTFKHPKPFLQKAVAVQIAERKTEPLPDNKILIIERRPDLGLPLPPVKK